MASEKDKRRRSLVKRIDSAGSMTFKEIKHAFPDVSEMTLRTDLKELDEAHSIVRTFGGARSVEFAIGADAPFSQRSVNKAEEKTRIAEKAVELLADHSVICIDSGSTTAVFAGLFPNERRIVVTASLPCASDLAKLKNVETIMLGGSLNQESLCLEGERSLAALQDLHFEQLYLGTTAYRKDTGFTCEVNSQSALKRAFILRSDEVIMLMDSSKVGRSGTFRFCDLSDVDTIVSDGNLPKSFLSDCKKAKVQVI